MKLYLTLKNVISDSCIYFHFLRVLEYLKLYILNYWLWEYLIILQILGVDNNLDKMSIFRLQNATWTELVHLKYYYKGYR
jgi:hypothetical protein